MGIRRADGRAALLDTFSYDRRDFGQAVYPAEVVAAIQGVAGVVSVDLDALGGIEATDVATGKRIDNVAMIVPRLRRPGKDGPLAAQIAYLPTRSRRSLHPDGDHP